ncbi:MAG: hypothetical protein ACR2N7_01050 [Acidimicrobiia bacterium]
MTAHHTAVATSAKQGGVIRREQAIGIGMTPRQIDHRVHSGDWHRVMAGGYRVLDLDSCTDRVRAAIALLPHAVVSHFSAVDMLGIGPKLERSASVLVHSRTTHRFPGVRVFRCHDLLDRHVVTVDRLPITTAARTLIDLSGVVTRPRLEYLVDDALASRTVDLDELSMVLGDVARRGKPGVTQFRKVLESRAGDPPSTSVLEAKGNRLLISNGLAGFRTEYSIPWAPEQRFDVAYPEDRVAIEWDSRRWHSQVDAFDSDRNRDRLATVNGWRLVRFSWQDVHDRPDSVVHTVASLLNS